MTRLAPRSPLALLALLLVACAALLAGCGEDVSKDDYEAGLRKVQRQLADANDASRESGETTDTAERSAKLEQAHDKIAEAAKTAKSLTPPEDAKKAHAKLAKALDDYAVLFGELAAMKPGATNESELYARAGEIVDDLGDANRTLSKLGYDAKSGSK